MYGPRRVLSSDPRKCEIDHILADRFGQGKCRAADETYGAARICGKDCLSGIGTRGRYGLEGAGLGRAVYIQHEGRIHLCADGNICGISGQIDAAAVDGYRAARDGEIIGAHCRRNEGNSRACRDRKGYVGAEKAVYRVVGSAAAIAVIAAAAIAIVTFIAGSAAAGITTVASSAFSAACAVPC